MNCIWINICKTSRNVNVQNRFCDSLASRMMFIKKNVEFHVFLNFKRRLKKTVRILFHVCMCVHLLMMITEFTSGARSNIQLPFNPSDEIWTIALIDGFLFLPKHLFASYDTWKLCYFCVMAFVLNIIFTSTERTLIPFTVPTLIWSE